MLFNHLNKNKIFVSIASLMDLELAPTVYDMLDKASNPKNIFVSVFAQDDNPPQLEIIFDHFKTKYSYRKVHPREARGLGFARYMTWAGHDIEDYNYFLQIDSHMRFDQDWDIELMNRYAFLHRQWGPMIMSVYPPAYRYVDDINVERLQESDPPCVKMVKSKSYLNFDAKYCKYKGGSLGQETGYFCGGFAFGYSEYFNKVKPDPLIYFNGEEQLMSVRFHQQDIKIICPPYVPIYHDYEGVRRKRLWDTNPDKNYLEQQNRRRVIEFYLGEIKDGYGISDDYKFIRFMSDLVLSQPDEDTIIHPDDSEWNHLITTSQ